MAHTELERRNLELVLEMYQRVLVAMDSSQVDRYMQPDYIQHSRLAEPGVAGLKAFLDRIRVESPHARTFIKRVFADGDHVVVHVHVVIHPGTPGIAVVDIFRCQEGRVAEHWEVIQEVPVDSPNPLPMF